MDRVTSNNQTLKAYGYTPPCFCTIFTKGNNFCDFLAASLGAVALTKWGQLLKERIAPVRVGPN